MNPPPKIIDESYTLFKTTKDISIAVNEMAKQISKNKILYDWDNPPVVIGILDGCIPFYKDLTAQFEFPHFQKFIHASSYGNSITPNKTVKLNFLHKDLRLDNKAVLLIDDINDTGNTLKTTINEFYTLWNIKVMLTACLFTRGTSSFKPNYSGFKLNHNKFLVGYGLDYMGYNRQLSSVFTL